MAVEEMNWMLGWVFDRFEQSDHLLSLYMDANPDNPICVQFLHHSDCCEDVRIEEVHGDLEDLIGSPILQAECVSERGPSKFDTMYEVEYMDESHTWTFYKMATNKGSVTIRWLGTSNGYYSESVDVEVNGMDPERFLKERIEKDIMHIAGIDLL